MSKLMRNVRTGKLAVYDRELVESGRWIEVTNEPAPKKSVKDSLALKDELEVVITRSAHESVESEA
jgi:hypothetical protein